MVMKYQAMMNAGMETNDRNILFNHLRQFGSGGSRAGAFFQKHIVGSQIKSDKLNASHKYLIFSQKKLYHALKQTFN